MIKKYIVWHKLKNRIYQKGNHSDETMATLSIFLDDGLEVERYTRFLKDNNREDGFFNISKMEKNGNLVTVIINPDIFPGLPPFTTTIENMITILEKYNHLENLGVDRIEIILSNNDLIISGDWIN